MSTARDLAATPGLSQIAEVLAAGGDRLSGLLERAEDRLGEVAVGYGAELQGHVSGTLSAGGKRLRPMLVFISAGERFNLTALSLTFFIWSSKSQSVWK